MGNVNQTGTVLLQYTAHCTAPSRKVFPASAGSNLTAQTDRQTKSQNLWHTSLLFWLTIALLSRAMWLGANVEQVHAYCCKQKNVLSSTILSKTPFYHKLKIHPRPCSSSFLFKCGASNLKSLASKTRHVGLGEATVTGLLCSLEVFKTLLL